MPEPSSLISFLLVALVVIVVPGPSVVFVIGRAMILGTRGALLSVWGNAVGVGVQIVAVALGVGSLVYASEVLFSVVKVLGSLFLIYLGIQGIVAPETVCERFGNRCFTVDEAGAFRQRGGRTDQR